MEVKGKIFSSFYGHKEGINVIFAFCGQCQHHYCMKSADKSICFSMLLQTQVARTFFSALKTEYSSCILVVNFKLSDHFIHKF